MNQEKASPGRRALNTVLLLINIALIGWIVVSWRGQVKMQPAADESSFLGAYDVDTAALSDPIPADGADPSPAPAEEPDVTSGGSGMDSWILNADGSGQTSVPQDAVQRPSLEELESWKQTIGYLPPDARDLTDFDDVTGSWKGFVQYDAAEEMVNVTVSGSASSLTLTVDWYMIHYFGDGSWENEEQMEDTALTGSWSNGGMTVTGAGEITFYALFESNGQQAAFGEWTLPDGSVALLGMVRP